MLTYDKTTYANTSDNAQNTQKISYIVLSVNYKANKIEYIMIIYRSWPRKSQVKNWDQHSLVRLDLNTEQHVHT